jgi:predicted TIM-barrel fold metal-dependent hydrolase
MFSIDYPFEDSNTAGRWIENAALTVAEMDLVFRHNARRILANMG